MSLRDVIEKDPKELLTASDISALWVIRGMTRIFGASPEGFALPHVLDGAPIFRLDLGRVRQSYITVGFRVEGTTGSGITTYTPKVELFRVSDDASVASVVIAGGVTVDATSNDDLTITVQRPTATENDLYMVLSTITTGGNRDADFSDVYVMETIFNDNFDNDQTRRPFLTRDEPVPAEIFRTPDPEVVAIHEDIAVSTGGVPGTSFDFNELDRDVADHDMVFAGRPSINYFRGDTVKTAVVRKKVDPFVGTRLQVGMMWLETTSTLRVTVEIEDELGAVTASRDFFGPGASLVLLRTNFDITSMVGPPTDLLNLPGFVVIYVWSDAAQTATVQGIRIIQGTATGANPERYLQAVPP